MGKYKFVLLVFPKKNVGTYFTIFGRYYQLWGIMPQQHLYAAFVTVYTCTFASSKFLNAKIVCF